MVVEILHLVSERMVFQFLYFDRSMIDTVYDKFIGEIKKISHR